MSRSSTLILIGVLIALTPFSGLPSILRTLLTVIFGFVILGFGVAERSRQVRAAREALAAQGMPTTATQTMNTPELVERFVPHGVSPI